MAAHDVCWCQDTCTKNDTWGNKVIPDGWLCRLIHDTAADSCAKASSHLICAPVSVAAILAGTAKTSTAKIFLSKCHH